MSTDYGKKFTLASQICRKEFYESARMQIENFHENSFKNESILASLSNDWIHLLHDMSPSFDEVFEECEMSTWNFLDIHFEKLRKSNCAKLFSTIITNEGVCFTFNGISDVLRVDSVQTEFRYHNITRSRDGWDPETGYTKANVYPFRGIVVGALRRPAGLKIVLNANLSDATPYCSAQDVGYKITINVPSAYPQLYENYIPISYGRELTIDVLPKTLRTDENLRSLEPNLRQCYFNDERKLKYYTFYNEQNCRLECYTNNTKYLFERVPFSSPRDPNTTNTFLVEKNDGWDLTKLFSLKNDFQKMYDNSDKVEGAYQCNCLSECNAIYYKAKITNLNEKFSVNVADKGAIDKNIIQTTVEIVFNNPSFVGQKRVRMYTLLTMISDFGGLLGLFMGGSLLSLIELFYFLVIRNCFVTNEIVAPN